MKLDQVLKLKLLLVVALCSTASACPPTEEHPKTVSDFCLNDRRLTVSVPPTDGDDIDNQWDTLETVLKIFQHNEVYDQLCVKPSVP